MLFLLCIPWRGWSSETVEDGDTGLPDDPPGDGDEALEDMNPETCVVSTRAGFSALQATVTDETSIVAAGLVRSKAWLDGDSIRTKGLFWTSRIGAIDGDVVVFGRGSFAFESPRITGPTLVVRRGVVKITYTSSGGCTTRQLALGAVHLNYVIASSQTPAAAP